MEAGGWAGCGGREGAELGGSPMGARLGCTEGVIVGRTWPGKDPMLLLGGIPPIPVGGPGWLWKPLV